MGIFGRKKFGIENKMRIGMLKDILERGWQKALKGGKDHNL